jgi:hypothetical protein
MDTAIESRFKTLSDLDCMQKHYVNMGVIHLGNKLDSDQDRKNIPYDQRTGVPPSLLHLQTALQHRPMGGRLRHAMPWSACGKRNKAWLPRTTNSKTSCESAVCPH